MIKKILLKLLLNLYIGKNREITKFTPEREFNLYLMKTSADIEDLLKAEISARMIRYYEAKSDLERAVIRGGIMDLKLLKDRHITAVKMNKDDLYKNNDSLKIKHWLQFKKLNN